MIGLSPLRAAFLFLITGLVPLTSPAVFAASCDFESAGLCRISIDDQLPSGKTFDISAEEERLSNSNQSGNNDSGYWGNGGATPDTRISKISLEVDGIAFHIPEKSYSDLGNITALEIKENQHAIVLVINGGQSDSAYYATFVFIDSALRKRTVRNKLHPGSLWEKTTYRELKPRP
ncbi:MAG: hypothetical protein AAF353_02790 [Pseudomonadota bacterium]